MTKEQWVSLKKGDRVICLSEAFISKNRETATVHMRHIINNDYIFVIFDRPELNHMLLGDGVKIDFWGNYAAFEPAP
jgi:hypothetical protein